MYKNYYIFKRQTDVLSKRITKATLDVCYTSRKDEVVLRLADQPLQIHISIRRDMPYLFLKPEQNIRKVHFKLFPQLTGQVIENIEIRPCNKHVVITTTHYRIHALFYGLAQNIYICGPDDTILDSFKSGRSPGKVITPDEMEEGFSEDCCRILAGKGNKIPVIAFIKYACPAYNKIMQNEILVRSGLAAGSTPGRSVLEEKLIPLLRDFNRELTEGPIYLYRMGETFRITLFKSRWLEEQGFNAEVYTDINKAWPAFAGKTDYAKSYHVLYRQISGVLTKRKQQIEKALQKLSEAQDIEKRKEIADMKGNILLSFKHKVPRGVSRVTLPNIFSEKNEPVEIKLNPGKTTAENAQAYFNKYKNLTERKEVLLLKKAGYTKELQEIKALLEKIDKTIKIDQLKQIRKELIARHLLQESHSAETAQGSNLRFSFKRVILDNRWDVYIGKNARNNDLLTFHFANKWDVWLHAQGVPGSHVVIKKQRKEEIVPKNIIEKAARLAAANSKSKHSGTVPVLYTEARYVNRIRKAPPGTVAVKNENVLFVEPLNMNQI